jgi:apolipoprotein N-acyltransferase
VLPETAIPRFLDLVDPAYLARLEAGAKRNGGDVLVGIPMRAGREAYTNSVLSLGTAPRQAYHKVHLVPFGEFVPPAFGWALRLVQIPLGNFSRGTSDQPALALAGLRVAVNVCYEDAFGDEMARRAAQATLLVNVSNFAWFGVARLRAVELGRMHLAATNTGITAAIDRDGRVVARLPQFTEGRLEIAAQGYSGITPYMRFADWPIVLLSIVILAVAVFAARRSR